MVQNPPSDGNYYGPDGRNLNTEPQNPNEQLGFEITPRNRTWSFTPEYYPSDLTHMKSKELDRYGGNCGAQSVSIETVKNREFHISGILLRGELSVYNSLIDLVGKVDLISPTIPGGGMECYIKQGEVGNEVGWDAHHRQRQFEYTVDLVSTGRDEREDSRNAIITDIFDTGQTEPVGYQDGL